MLIPIQIDATQAKARGIQEGWWAASQFGEPVAGPYPTKEAAIVAIAKRGEDQPTGLPGEAPPAPEGT
ncbi:hypothetical protein ACLBXM_06625 [Xanthobacteraceae bacterium A53D]